VTPSTARPRTAAITDAGSGLGREIALKLAAKGYQVFGTALHDDEVHDLSAASDGRVSLSITDITKSEFRQVVWPHSSA
jgi:NADP-dependent 3-hydroxy acid dehydrogenase YdfG